MAIVDEPHTWRKLDKPGAKEVDIETVTFEINTDKAIEYLAENGYSVTKYETSITQIIDFMKTKLGTENVTINRTKGKGWR